jgi:hypothetical protein
VDGFARDCNRHNYRDCLPIHSDGLGKFAVALRPPHEGEVKELRPVIRQNKGVTPGLVPGVHSRAVIPKRGLVPGNECRDDEIDCPYATRHCEPTGIAFGDPEDKLREAIQSGPHRASGLGLLRRSAPRNEGCGVRSQIKLPPSPCGEVEKFTGRGFLGWG